MTRQVMSVNGPIDPDSLGFTSMHEHVLMDGAYMHESYYRKALPHPFLDPNDPTTLSNISYVRHNAMATYAAVDLQNAERMVLEVADYKKTGGDSMLDCTAVGLRVDVPAVIKIGRRTGVNIVGCTGFYMSTTWPKRFRGLEVQDYYNFMQNEIENGIEGTEALPGALKIGFSNANEDEMKALRAAARISKDNDMCLTLHPGGDIHKAIDVMLEEGMKPENAVIAHVNLSCFQTSLSRLVKDPSSWGCFDPTYLQRFLDRGVNLSFEFFGNTVDFEMNGSIGPIDWATLAYVYHFVEKGYASQIVFGCDICTDMCTRRGGGEGYTRQTIFVMNTMRHYVGFSEESIDTITRQNPKRLLAFTS